MTFSRSLGLCLSVFVALSCQGARRPDAEQPATGLLAGQVVAEALRAGNSHSYSIEIGAGEHVAFSAEQRGIDLRLFFGAPNGTDLLEEGGVPGTVGSERIDFVAKEAGRYRLQVTADGHGAQRGNYTLTVHGPRRATAVDKKRSRALVITNRARKFARDAGEKLPASVTDWQAALELWTALGDEYRQAEACEGLGRSYWLLGQRAKSLKQRERALALFSKVGARHGQAMSLYGLGLSHALLGDLDRSSEMYELAIAHSRAVGDSQTEAKSLHNLGANHQDLDELSLALESYDKAQQTLLAIGDDGEYTHLARGSIYDALGKGKEALFHFEEARRSLHKKKMIWDEASAIARIAAFHLRRRDDPKRARSLFESALALHREAGDPAGEASTLTELGVVYQRLALGKCESHEEAVALHKKLGSLLPMARALRARGDCLFALGNSKRALADLGGARRLAQSLGSRSVEAASYLSLARMHRKAGDLKEARTAMASALALLEDVRSRVNEQEFRTTFAARTRRFYDEYIDLLMQEPRSARNVARAFVISERSRARTLLETLRLSDTHLWQNIAAELLTKERQRSRRLKMEEHRHQAALARSAGARELDASRARVAAALDDYRAVQAEVRLTSPAYAAVAQPAPLDLGMLQRALPARTALVEYSLGEDQSYLWRVTASEIKVFVLPGRKRIEQQVRGLLADLTQRNDKGASLGPAALRDRVAASDQRYWQRASELAEAVLWPALRDSHIERLLIVPDGALHYVPFAALPTPAATRPEPLVVSHEVVTLPSAAVLLALRKAGDEGVADDVAIIADPVFDAEDPRVTPQETTYPAQSPYYPRLRFSLKEADAIKTVAHAAKRTAFVAVDFQASRDLFVRDALARYGIIHIAAHGLIDSEHAELSSVVLSRVFRDGKPRDGMLRLQDIYNLRLGAGLVVLSACETALGKEISGEGIVGLTRGFFYAGSKRVMASLWRIGDRSTSVLMERFYKAMLTDHLSPAAALRMAQVSMWTEKKWGAPYYWAPFVLQGEFL